MKINNFQKIDWMRQSRMAATKSPSHFHTHWITTEVLTSETPNSVDGINDILAEYAKRNGLSLTPYFHNSFTYYVLYMGSSMGSGNGYDGYRNAVVMWFVDDTLIAKSIPMSGEVKMRHGISISREHYSTPEALFTTVSKMIAGEVDEYFEIKP